MSLSHSDEGTVPGQALACSDSFWEVGQFKRTVRRVDDGLHLCHNLVAMVKERGEIEAAHARQLSQWAKKWEDAVTKGPEYGTMQTAWLAALSAAEKTAELHLRTRDRLEEEVQKTIKLWSKEQYHKTAFSGLKETKEVDEAFKKAQKQWSKLYTKVDKAKKDYYTSCRLERSAINQEKNAQSDTSISVDQTKKFTERVEKCAEEVRRSREIFQKSLDEINEHNSKYVEEMRQVFERCQEMERKRLKFFKEILLNVHKCLDMSSEPKLKSIHDEFQGTVQSSDENADLTWWDQNHGTAMAMNWPQFEEYKPELRQICKEPKNKDGITLIATKPVGAHTDPVARQISNSLKRDSIHSLKNGGVPVLAGKGGVANGTTLQQQQENGGGAARKEKTPAPDVGAGGGDASSAVRLSSAEPSPFDDDWDATPPPRQARDANAPPPPPPPHGAQAGPATAVRALYDYVGQEEDELSFLKGETFDKLEDEDEQGWCKGRKDGKVGLYPANYVDQVS